MKKIATLTTALLLGVTAAQAQGGYFRIGLGYAFPQAGQVIDRYSNTVYNGEVTMIDGDITKFDAKKVSFNSGFQATVAGGYMVSRFVGVELGATIGLAPRKFESTLTNTYIDNNTTVTETTVQEFRAPTPVMLTPALVLQTGGSNVNLYARGGVVLPMNAKLKMEGDYRASAPASVSYTEAYTYETKTYFAPGFSGAMGVKGYIAKNIAIWGEASLTSLTLNVKEVELTEAIINGKDVLAQITDKVDEFDVEGSATNSISYQLPYSNMAINVGISFGF